MVMTAQASVSQTLQRACSRNLWMASPPELEDYIVAFAMEGISAEGIDDSVYRELFELAATCALWWHAGVLDLSNPNPYAQGNEYPVDVQPIVTTTVYDTVVRTECL